MPSDSFPIPDPTVVFLGGPLDGHTAEPEVSNPLDAVFPEYIRIDGDENLYWRMDPELVPDWVVKKPQMDAFDAVYLWEPTWGVKAGANG